MFRLIILLIALGVAVSGCGKQADPAAKTGKTNQAQADTTAKATADVVPGSYEDWCEEHGVPESACTRCNPSLIAAFKATNDWCDEHGVPESQCLRCNPNVKIVRPPKPEGI